MNENASDENTVTGKAMGNIMGIAASAAVLVGSAYAGTALLGKGVKGAKAVASKAKQVASRKGASEEFTEFGTKVRNTMKENPGMSGAKATKVTKKNEKIVADRKLKNQLDEYDFGNNAKSYKESKEFKDAVNKHKSDVANQQKKQADVLNKDLFGETMKNGQGNIQDQIKGYEEFMTNDVTERKTQEAVSGAVQ